MAAIAFFIFLTLTLSSTIHARESQFFNRFSNKEFQPLNTNQQQPEFIPQTQDSASYGLYGHQSGQLPPSTTVNNNNLPANLPENYNPVAYTTPIHSSTQDIPDEFKDTQTYSQQQDEFTGSNNDGNMYKYEKQGFDDARFMETQDGEKQGRYNQDEDMYNSQMQGMGETKYESTSNNANTYNSEKQGMSDTRYLENGKFYYDVNMKNFNDNANMNTRGFSSRNEYNTQGQGYFGNSYDRYNSNLNGGRGGYYQDQEDQFNP
ncbi:hypothetical protein R6Q57_028061 [Mikania cordata]